MSNFEYSASLVFKSDSASIDRLVTAIPRRPEYLNRIGQLRVAANGAPITGRYYKYNYCSYVLNRVGDEGASECLVRHLMEIKDYDRVIRDFLTEGGAAYVYISWYTGQYRGEVFSVKALRCLADLGIDLGIEVFESADVDGGCAAK